MSDPVEYRGYEIRVLNWNGRYYAFIQQEGSAGGEQHAPGEEPRWYESPEQAIAALKSSLDASHSR